MDVEDFGLPLYDRIQSIEWINFRCLLEKGVWTQRTKRSLLSLQYSNWIGSVTTLGLHSASGGKLRWGNPPSALSLKTSNNSLLIGAFLLMPVQDISHVVEVRELTREAFCLVLVCCRLRKLHAICHRNKTSVGYQLIYYITVLLT